MGLFDRFKKRKIEGIIGYLGLDDFWTSLSFEESEALIKYSKSSLGADPKSSPIEGKITQSSANPLSYLGSYIGWTVADHNYQLADKIIRYCDQIYENASPVDKHFYLLSAAECYYKQRATRPMPFL